MDVATDMEHAVGNQERKRSMSPQPNKHAICILFDSLSQDELQLSTVGVNIEILKLHFKYHFHVININASSV